jgi:hypothetical protein
VGEGRDDEDSDTKGVISLMFSMEGQLKPHAMNCGLQDQEGVLRQ